MAKRKTSQAQRVLEYMEEFGGITQLDALKELGVMRLASRITDLRKRGYKIGGEMVDVKNRYGETVSIKRYKINQAE